MLFYDHSGFPFCAFIEPGGIKWSLNFKQFDLELSHL